MLTIFYGRSLLKLVHSYNLVSDCLSHSLSARRIATLLRLSMQTALANPCAPSFLAKHSVGDSRGLPGVRNRLSSASLHHPAPPRSCASRSASRVDVICDMAPDRKACTRFSCGSWSRQSASANQLRLDLALGFLSWRAVPGY